MFQWAFAPNPVTRDGVALNLPCEMEWWIPRLVKVILDAARGIQHMHTAGYAHLDLNSRNILFRGLMALPKCRGAVCDLAFAQRGVKTRLSPPKGDSLPWRPRQQDVCAGTVDVFGIGVLLQALCHKRRHTTCMLPEHEPTPWEELYAGAPFHIQDAIQELHAIANTCKAPCTTRVIHINQIVHNLERVWVEYWGPHGRGRGRA